MTQANSNIFEKHPKKTLLVIILVLFLILDFGTAAVLKTLGVFKPSYVSSKLLEASYRQKDPVYHHTLKPNTNFDQAEWGRKTYTVNTNSLGFKDNEVREISLNSNNKRILLIGDSFTEGVGLEFKNTFAGIFQESLRSKNIDVLNAGVTSYSPIIYLRKTQYLIETIKLKFDHLVVFIDLSDIEDEAKGYKFDQQNNVVSRSTIAVVGKTTQKINVPQKKNTSFKEFMTQNTLILGRIRNLSGWLRNTMRPWDRALKQRRAMWTLDENIYADYAIKGLPLAEQHMTQLKNILDKNNISLTVVVYPWPDQIYNNDINSKQVTFWQKWSFRNQVEFINLFPGFLKLKTKPEDTIKTYFIPGDVHWNNLGHQFVASNLLKSLNFLK